MNKTFKALLFTLSATLLSNTLPANAHHSFPAQYDIEKPVTLTGNVTTVEWTNPHIFIHMNVTDEATGKVESWTLELGGPNALLRAGWKRDSLKMDDLITIDGSLARDGSNLVNARSIVMVETGKKMLTASSEGSQ